MHPEIGAPEIAHSVRLTADAVLILDRRKLPLEREWVRCETVAEVARAIKDMVTQSSGPYFAALYGMVLAARAGEDLEAAGQLLVDTRRTNNHLRKAVHCVLSSSDRSEAGVLAAAEAGDELYRARSRALAEAAARLVPDGARVLTHCWADIYLIELVVALRKAGKEFSFTCTETRPYLQGARLTAPTLAEMGVDTTLVTDGMGAAVIADGRVDALVTAADRVTMDGHVINKVGTLGLASAAQAFGVPFHALVQAPDQDAPSAEAVPIEYRDPEEVLAVLGSGEVPGVRGLYPAFDITPPRLVTTVVTDRGAFAPADVHEYYAEGERNQ
ncbi:translation initiation factor eIF-2B alpha/beta/delta subunit family protein [Allokutzneria albata]|uniref:Methylthioribose-1-phosphate isomerase n=1 Tax=Allokutzneria albata TaxID=211114 RepID=A0A1G9RQ66_ALLAB|nr:methylthioribose-1-phosphate isomerase [Allokutzneria albata]SDM24615.1 methylthioribose-1-phosphate isomerase [Allokutzneria albata]